MAMRVRAARLLASAGTIGTGLALGACMPITYGEPVSYGGVVQQTPVPAWADITGFDDYEWIDRADAVSQTIGDSPPDISFAWGGSQPWAWTLEDGTLLLVEQQSDGPHAYYFEPDSDAPFLVRDPGMSFGFIGSEVAVIYAADGALLDRTTGEPWLIDAMRGWERGRMLRAAMLNRHETIEEPVEVAMWVDTSLFLYNWQLQWDEGCRRNDRWRKHRDSDRAVRWRRHLEVERHSREETADRFWRWRDRGYQGTAPGHWRRPEGPGGPGAPGTGGPRPGRPDWAGRPGRPGRPGGASPTTPGTPPVTPVATGPDVIEVPDRGKPGPGETWNGTRPGTPGTRPGNRPGRDGVRPRPSPQPGGAVPPSVPVADAPPVPVPVASPVSPAPPAPAPQPVESEPALVERPDPRPVKTMPVFSPRPTERGAPPARVPRATFAPPAAGYSPPAAVPRFTPPTPAAAPRSAPPVRSYSPPPSAPVRSASPPPAPTRSYSPPPPPPPPPVRSSPPPPPAKVSTGRSDGTDPN